MSAEDSGTAILFIVSGVAAVTYTLYLRGRLRRSEDWREVTGTIIESAVKVETGFSEGPSAHWCHVVYEYVVDGCRYTGKRVEFGDRHFLTKKKAQRHLVRYPLHARVAVYFDPLHPADLVLKRQIAYRSRYMVLGIVFLVTGVAIAVVGAIREP